MSTDHQDDETRVRYKATWSSLFWVLVLASLIRCVFLVALHGNLNRDPDTYRKLAGNVLETGSYGWKTAATDNADTGALGDEVRPTAFRPPLYPLFLIVIGGVRSIWPIAVLHWALGVATAGLVACLGWRAGLGRWAVVAAMLVALDPILLQQSTLVMTETLATFLAALALFCLSAKASSSSWLSATTWPSAVTGMVLGLCVLCRPTFLPWLGLIALARVAPWRSMPDRGAAVDPSGRENVAVASPFSTRVAHMGVLVGSALLVMSPWVIRNQMVFGKAKLTTTHGGYTMLLGNNPLFYRFLQSGSHGTWDGSQLGRAWQGRSLTNGPTDDQWADLPKLARRAERQPSVVGSEFGDDDLAYSLAKRYIGEQPAMFAYASGLRITRLWRLVPHRVVERESTLRMTFRYLIGVWYALVLGLAIVGLLRLGRGIFAAPWLYGVQLCFVFTAVHALYWSDMRMRAPLMPLVCLAAASGMAAIGGRFRQRKT